MKDNKNTATLIKISSVSQHHQLLSLPKPKHPLLSILKFEDLSFMVDGAEVKFTMDFYTIAIKKGCDCKLKYGQTSYDFNEGVMNFFSPNQLHALEANTSLPPSGWLLNIHPDLIRTYPLAKNIKEYGFFFYGVNEALILSESEEATIENIFINIEKEYHLPIDRFSQDVIVAQLELLLTYCNRYYNRQFITRKIINNDLLSRVEVLLSECFETDKITKAGVPSVTYLAGQLNMSPKYFSDTLRSLTGQSAQQHIQYRLMEKAKQLLTTTSLSVSEIAYELGFEYPQSFNKLFKKKTNLSPLAFRHSFN
jgi:AraC family transcriptional activator of pobA